MRLAALSAPKHRLAPQRKPNEGVGASMCPDQLQADRKSGGRLPAGQRNGRVPREIEQLRVAKRQRADRFVDMSDANRFRSELWGSDWKCRQDEGIAVGERRVDFVAEHSLYFECLYEVLVGNASTQLETLSHCWRVLFGRRLQCPLMLPERFARGDFQIDAGGGVCMRNRAVADAHTG